MIDALGRAIDGANPVEIGAADEVRHCVVADDPVVATTARLTPLRLVWAQGSVFSPPRGARRDWAPTSLRIPF